MALRPSDLCGSPREARRKETDTLLIAASHSTRFDMPRARKQIVKYHSNCSVPPSEQLHSYPLKVIMKILLKHHQWLLMAPLGLSLYRSQLMQLYIPQPLDPQLSTWTITGMLERLNSFRGERQHSA